MAAKLEKFDAGSEYAVGLGKGTDGLGVNLSYLHVSFSLKLR